MKSFLMIYLLHATTTAFRLLPPPSSTTPRRYAFRGGVTQLSLIDNKNGYSVVKQQNLDELVPFRNVAMITGS